MLLPIAIAAIAVPAWSVATYRAPSPAPSDEDTGYRRGKIAGEPSDAQIARWQKLADASCECVRRGGADGTCWSQYDRENAPYGKGDMATLCIPVSHSWDCFGDEFGTKCVEIDRKQAGQLLCSNAERNAVEAAWNYEMRKARGNSDAEVSRAFDRANAAIDRVYQRIQRGESLASVRGTPGCSG